MHKRQFFQALDRTLFGYSLKTWSHSLRYWAEVHQYLNLRQQVQKLRQYKPSSKICLMFNDVRSDISYSLKVFSWRSKVTWKRSKVQWDIISGCRTIRYGHTDHKVPSGAKLWTPWENILQHLTTSGLHFINLMGPQANCQLRPKFWRVWVHHCQACTTLMDLNVILAKIRPFTVNLGEH